MNLMKTTLVVLAGLAATASHAEGNALFRAEQACIKYAGPAAQDECRRRQKEAMEAFRRDEAQKARDAAQPADSAAPRKNGLCFTREGTGERVCPN